MRYLVMWLMALVIPAMVMAQAPARTPEDRTPRRVATAGYTLALSWSPEYCHRRRGDAECSLPSARGFTLHGLWPDGADPKRWPQYCRATSPLTPAQLRAGQGATPSPRLLQHEWDKHGSCMASDPAAYFADEQRLFRAVRFPDMAALSRRRDLTVGIVAGAFAAANPGVTPAMVRLDLNRRGWLEEVRLCLGLDRRPARCPTGGDAPPASAKVRVQAPI